MQEELDQSTSSIIPQHVGGGDEFPVMKLPGGDPDDLSNNNNNNSISNGSNGHVDNENRTSEERDAGDSPSVESPSEHSDSESLYSGCLDPCISDVSLGEDDSPSSTVVSDTSQREQSTMPVEQSTMPHSSHTDNAVAIPPPDTPLLPSDTPLSPSDTPLPPSDTPLPPPDTPLPPSDTPLLPSDTPLPPSDTPLPPPDTPLPLTDTPLPLTDTPPPELPPSNDDESVKLVPDDRSENSDTLTEPESAFCSGSNDSSPGRTSIIGGVEGEGESEGEGSPEDTYTDIVQTTNTAIHNNNSNQIQDKQSEIERLSADNMNMSDTIAELQQERDHLLSEVTTMKKDAETDKRTKLLQMLENKVIARDKELEIARLKLSEVDKIHQKTLNTLKKDHQHRLEQASKIYQETLSEKESMVIKYALSEKEFLDAKKLNNQLDKRNKDLTKEVERLNNRVKDGRADISKHQQLLDAKDADVLRAQREKEQIREELSALGVKFRWAQTRFTKEVESHNEMKNKHQQTLSKLAQSKEECEMIRRDCQQMIRQYQESEEMKSNSLEHELKEKAVEIMTYQQETQDNMEIQKMRVKELDSLKKSHQDNLELIKTLKDKVTCLEKELSKESHEVGNYQLILNKQKRENLSLEQQVTDLPQLKHQLDREREMVSELQTEMKHWISQSQDQTEELEELRNKESQFLTFSGKVSEMNAHLQSEYSTVCSKLESTSSDAEKLRIISTQLKTHNSQLAAELEEEKNMRHTENELLTSRIEEKSKAVEQLSLSLEEAIGETKVLKRKQGAVIKDLTKQLQLIRRRLETFESNQTIPRDDSISLGSRTSSSGSLENGGHAITNTTSSVTTPPAHDDNHIVHDDHSSTTSSQSGSSSVDKYPELDKNLLVDKLLRIQKQLIRRTEKIEFLDDHVTQLVEELKKKTKIIQYYVMREETGALVPPSTDQTKARLAKRGGIMASLYSNQHNSDSTMTIELSLEINRKLQAVLEDILLKNITLKDNIDTLGNEITRLTNQKQSWLRSNQS